LSILLLLPDSLRGQSDRTAVAPHFPSNLSLPDRGRIPSDPPLDSTLRRRFSITSGPFDFTQMTRAAGLIFSGTVTAIAPRPATARSVETVAITFHVEQALRGVIAGENFTILQWIGLWTSGQRYRTGERVLVFLYPPSKLGLTSSVAGPIGRFSVDLSGQISLSAQQLSAFRADPVLGGKSRAGLGDFAEALQLARE
jgi:hypothetical protein